MFSKKAIREMIEEKFGKEGEIDIKDVLQLFASKSSGGSSEDIYVYDESDNLVGKRCSYFNVYMPIEEFGKRGDSYSYQSKLAESIQRKQRTQASREKKELDVMLANNEIDVDEWKSRLQDIETNRAKIAIEEVEEAKTIDYAKTKDDFLVII